VSRAASARGAPRSVRIVGGAWKRTPLPVVDLPGLRPTPDRVRETLFNWLGQDLTGWRCLDLFAGTGALGFEAASRGAAQVVMVERDASAVERLREVQRRLRAEQVQIVRADAPTWLGAQPGTFDLVFLDPPFHQGWLDRVGPLLPARLAPGAWVYVECEFALDAGAALLARVPGLKLHRADKAGQVHYHLLRLSDGAS